MNKKNISKVWVIQNVKNSPKQDKYFLSEIWDPKFENFEKHYENNWVHAYATYAPRTFCVPNQDFLHNKSAILL
jgi:hypothetical protein